MSKLIRSQLFALAGVLLLSTSGYASPYDSINIGDRSLQMYPELAQPELGNCMRAAEGGDADAQVRLADAYCRYDRRCVPLDYQLAFKWYQKAADQNNAFATFRLGEMYDAGMGRDENPVEAYKLFKKANDLGSVEAQFRLGRCYQMGRGVAKNIETAIALYTAAGKAGYVPAQYALGCIYSDDHAVSDFSARDVVNAHAWFDVAAGSNHPLAPMAADKRHWLREVMTVSQILEAESRALHSQSDINGAPYIGGSADALVNAKTPRR